MCTSTKLIRNSTAEFLIFTGQAGEQSIEARYEQETAWLTQKLLAELFAVDVRTVSEHLKNIYESDELERAATLRKFRTVQTEGHREVARNRVLGSHCQRLPRPRRRTGTAQNPYDHGRLGQATGCIS